MAEAKTKKTKASVAAFLATIEDPTRRADCHTLAEIMERVTGEPATMWGDAIVGFGLYRYQYASGQTGDWPLLGFSPRKGDLSVYIKTEFSERAALLATLGTHKAGKSCLYLKRLSNVDLNVLETLLCASVHAMEPTRVRG